MIIIIVAIVIVFVGVGIFYASPSKTSDIAKTLSVAASPDPPHMSNKHENEIVSPINNYTDPVSNVVLQDDFERSLLPFEQTSKYVDGSNMLLLPDFERSLLPFEQTSRYVNGSNMLLLPDFERSLLPI